MWLIVRQLNESRLASQMEGMLALGDLDLVVANYGTLLSGLMESDEWKAMDGEQACKFLRSREYYWQAYFTVVGYFERMGVLVRRRALDKGIARDLYGRVVVEYLLAFEKVTNYQRKETEYEKLAAHWEWLARQFRDFSG